MKRFFYRGSFTSQCGLRASVIGFFEREQKPDRAALTERFLPDARKIFAGKGQSHPVLVELAAGTCEELPEVPKPQLTTRPAPEKRWRFDVSFVCHDIKFGGDTHGVLAWPDEPTAAVRHQFVRVLLADIIVLRGDSAEYADYTEVLSCQITPTGEPATHA
jgi:hypothetical protein